MKKKHRSSRRYSDDEYDDDKPRRRERDDGYRSDGYRDHGYHSDGHRRHGRADGHTRFDGGADDGFDEINNRPRRQRSRAGRRDSDDRYGYGDGHRPPFRDTHPRKPRAQQETHYAGAGTRNHDPLDRPPMGFNAAPAAMGGGATMSDSAYGSPVPSPPQGAQSTSSLRGGISTGYVPYAHIYGGPTHPQPQHSEYAPPPMSEQGSVQPNFTNQAYPPTGPRPAVKRPPAGYHQNPLAQEAPAGNQPGYMVDPYSSPRHFDDRQDGYDAENEHPESPSPPRRRHSRRERGSSDRHSTRREHSRHGDRSRSQAREKRRYVDDHLLKPSNTRMPPKPSSR